MTELGLRARLAIATVLVATIALGVALARDERPPPRRVAHRAIPWRLPTIEWEPRPIAPIPDAGSIAISDLDGGVLVAVAPYDDEGIEEGVRELGPLARELIDRLCAPAARGICEHRERCGCAEPDGEACAEDVAAACESWVDCRWGYEEQDPGEVHTLAIDRGAVRACLEDMLESASECRDVVRPEVCERLIVAAARVGQRCEGEGSPCVGGVCREEVCRRLPGAGEECPEWECAHGLVCDGDRCVDPHAPRAECSGDEGCSWERVCIEGRCAPRGRVGSECGSDSECAIGTRCEGSACVRADTCDLEHGCGDGRACHGEQGARCLASPAPTGCPPGEDGCTLPGMGAPCPFSLCAEGLVCAIGTDGAARCTDRGLREGERCETSWGATPCAAGLACTYVVRDDPGGPTWGFVCRPTVGVGEDCEADPCAPGGTCTWGVLEGACWGAICEPIAPFTCGEG